MIEIIYASASLSQLDPQQLGMILSAARENNRRLGVTGILLYREGSFLQVLEGEPDVIAPLYERIAADHRHTRVMKLRQTEIETRSFSDWSMGFVSLDPMLIKQLPGRHGFSSNGSLQAESSQQLLATLDEFRNGRWRRYIV